MSALWLCLSLTGGARLLGRRAPYLDPENR